MSVMDVLRFERKRYAAYRALFLGGDGNLTDAGREVLKDIANYSMAHSDAVPTEATAIARHQGSVDVYNRILRFISVSPDRLFREVEKTRED